MGGSYFIGCNSEEGEIEIIMIRGKKYPASIIFIKKKMRLIIKSSLYSRAAFIYENAVCTKAISFSVRK